jgi:hypothetical protein
MTDQKIKDNGYDCGFFGTEPDWKMLDSLDDNQRDMWQDSADEGGRDQRDEASSAIADYHVMGSIYGYD